MKIAVAPQSPSTRLLVSWVVAPLVVVAAVGLALVTDRDATGAIAIISAPAISSEWLQRFGGALARKLSRATARPRPLPRASQRAATPDFWPVGDLLLAGHWRLA